MLRGGETTRYQERNLLPKEALKPEKEREGRKSGAVTDTYNQMYESTLLVGDVEWKLKKRKQM